MQMNSHQSITYKYYRSKTIMEDEKSGKLFFGFVSLSIMKEQVLGNKKVQKLIKGPVLFKECPIEEAPIQLVKLPNKDTEILLTKMEYELLEKIPVEGELAFWLYRTAIY